MNKKIYLIIAILLFLFVFIQILIYISKKIIPIYHGEETIPTKVLPDNRIKLPSVNVDYVVAKINDTTTKQNIIETNGWEYNEWILPRNNNKNTHYEVKRRNYSVWDDKGINIHQVEKIPHIIPKQLPNLGDSAVTPNENDWLFNPIRGTINLTK